MDYGGIMFKKIIYIIIFIYALISLSCSKNETVSNNVNTNILNTNNIQGNNYSNDINKNDDNFFDMKYVYKSIRVDKESFSNALLSYYQDPNYSNIINRNKDFLNRKLVGDNDIKKYAVDYISNTYHNHYSDNISGDDLYSEKLPSLFQKNAEPFRLSPETLISRHDQQNV